MNISTNTLEAGLGGAHPTETNSSSGGEATGKMQMGRQEFLKLLLTQMKNQDPLNPMKGQEFATHLAQFSSVEQLMNINETLSKREDSTQQLAESLQNSTAAGLIGKTVRADGSTVAISGQDHVEVPFSLEKRADTVTLQIRDEAGRLVRTIEHQGMSAGSHTAAWNGRGDDGERLPEGSYDVSISAADANGQTVDAATYLQGAVERVRFGSGTIELVVNGKPVALDQVRSVGQ